MNLSNRYQAWVAMMLVTGLGAAVIAAHLNLPAAWMIAPMLVAVGLNWLGVGAGKAPASFSDWGKILLGTSVGATFTRSTLLRLGRLIPLSVLATVALIVAALLLGRLISRLTGLDMSTAVFSLTPGGMAEMVAVGEESGADLPTVATLQFLRYVSIVVFVPPLVGWLLS